MKVQRLFLPSGKVRVVWTTAMERRLLEVVSSHHSHRQRPYYRKPEGYSAVIAREFGITRRAVITRYRQIRARGQLQC